VGRGGKAWQVSQEYCQNLSFLLPSHPIHFFKKGFMMAASQGSEVTPQGTVEKVLTTNQISNWKTKHIKGLQVVFENPFNILFVGGLSWGYKEGNIELTVIIEERGLFSSQVSAEAHIVSIASHWEVGASPVISDDPKVVEIFQSFLVKQGILNGVVTVIKNEKIAEEDRFSDLKDRIIVKGVKLTFPQEKLKQVLDNLSITSSEILKTSPASQSDIDLSTSHPGDLKSPAKGSIESAMEREDLSDRESLLEEVSKEASQPVPHSHRLRTGFCNNPFFDRSFKGTRLAKKAEPLFGYKDSNYFSFALREVFDGESRYFWLERRERDELVPSNSSTGLNALRLFFGVQDLYNATTSPCMGPIAPFLAEGGFYYLIMGGWVLSPLMNVVKAVTELPLKLIAEFFCWSKDSLREKYGENGLVGEFKAMAWYWQALYVVCRTLQLLFAGLHLLVRMVVSPVESVKVAYNAGYTHGWLNQALAVMSAVSSAICWLGLLIGGGPLLLLIAPKLGISLAPIAHSGLANFSAPITALLTTKLGFVASTALTGAVTLSTTILFFLGLHEIRTALTAYFHANKEGSTSPRPSLIVGGSF